MSDIKAVIDKCLEFMNIRLTFGSFSFTPMSVLIGLFILSIAITFVVKLFE